MQRLGERTILAFDYGHKRIGIAVGQELTATARPLTVLNNQKQFDWPGLEKLLKEWQPTLLVVGMPCHADGSANTVTTAVIVFIDELNKRFDLPIESIDERLSSHEARQLQTQIAAARGQKSGRRRSQTEPVDALAAALILQSWFNQQGKQ